MDPSLPARCRSRIRFPRTRGDGPEAVGVLSVPYELPPHTRGWTLRGDDGIVSRRASPAHAGMDPPPGDPQRCGHRFPRTRGDGPHRGSVPPARARLPPHTRGWTQVLMDRIGYAVASPAHAGMDRCPGRDPGHRRGFPRTRGDGPILVCSSQALERLPPHTRGWTVHGRSAEGSRRASPAHAGMDRRQDRSGSRRRRFPRTRGDGPLERCALADEFALPPHTRGWTRITDPDQWIYGASPAHAGMDPLRAGGSVRRPGFPRTSGDGPSASSRRVRPSRLPPHTRGWTPDRERRGLARIASPHTRGWTRCSVLGCQWAPKMSHFWASKMSHFSGGLGVVERVR